MAKSNGKATPKTDPLAGKSPADKKAAIEAAKAADEAAAKKPATKATRRPGLVVDGDRKAQAYALLNRRERERVEWDAAKNQSGSTPEHTEHVRALRAKKKVTQRQLNRMRGEDCDSVQAAENDFYAEREVVKAKADAEDAAARRIVAGAKRKAEEKLAATA